MRTDMSAKALRTYFSTEWRQLANSWPIAVIAFGVTITFAGAVLAVWLVLGLLDLAT
jgi:hypothetical protein